LEFEHDLAVILGTNSQGKTSIIEALEFMFTGSSSRRELLGSKGEHEGALRCAHLPAADSEMWVAAVIETPDGVEHQVRRTLVADYGFAEGCRSTLTIDGVPAASLAVLGYPLSRPPLGAPVLLHHALRYAIAAAPQQRSDYFKAVLEIADLDVVRREITQLHNVLARPPNPLLDKLAELARVPAFSISANALERNLAGPEAVQRTLTVALKTALEQAGVPDPGADYDLRIAALAAVLARSREATFPLADFRAREVPEPEDAPPDIAGLSQYVDALAAVDSEVARLSPIFTAVLALPDVAHAHDPVDCPVCQTPRALTPARLEALRAVLARGAATERAATAAIQVLARLRNELEQLRGIAERTQAPAARWTTEQLQERRAACTRLGVPAELLDQAHDGVLTTATRAGRLLTSLKNLDQALDVASEHVKARRAVAVTQLATTIEECRADRDRLAVARRDQRTTSEPLAAALKPVLDASVGQPGWVALAALANDPSAVAVALRRERAVGVVKNRLEQAVKDVEVATRKVLDARFVDMSNEVLRWWRTLRPDEPAVFGGLRRRATGKRYLDLKAALRSTDTAPPVTRDAVGVFSDSQLNALGLSSFLARTIMEGSPLIVLDDPVALSDVEHRVTFTLKTLKELLDSGIQVIFTTFDETVYSNTETQYWHRGLDQFEISLQDVVDGSIVTKTSDRVEALLAKAQLIIRLTTRDGRQQSAHLLRLAAERLAKLVIIAGKRRETGALTAWSDYDNKDLGQLIDLVTPYMTGDADEVGKWRIIPKLLNAGSHDDTPPDPRR
jgi:hypothetical protein